MADGIADVAAKHVPYAHPNHHKDNPVSEFADGVDEAINSTSDWKEGAHDNLTPAVSRTTRSILPCGCIRTVTKSSLNALNGR